MCARATVCPCSGSSAQSRCSRSSRTSSSTPAAPSRSPILTWAAREYYRQNDAADSLEEHLRAAKALWARALAGECDADHCLARSREFQNAIYYRRASSPLIVPLLYRFKRLQLEDDMNEAAANFLAD